MGKKFGNGLKRCAIEVGHFQRLVFILNNIIIGSLTKNFF
jgi:hypothetical protein